MRPPIPVGVFVSGGRMEILIAFLVLWAGASLVAYLGSLSSDEDEGERDESNPWGITD